MDKLLETAPRLKAQLEHAIARIETAEALVSVGEKDRATDVYCAAIATLRIYTSSMGKRA